MANQQANEGLGTLMIKQDKDLEQFINSKTADKYNDLLFGPNENSIYDDKNITAFQKSRKNERGVLAKGSSRH